MKAKGDSQRSAHYILEMKFFFIMPRQSYIISSLAAAIIFPLNPNLSARSKTGFCSGSTLLMRKIEINHDIGLYMSIIQ